MTELRQQILEFLQAMNVRKVIVYGYRPQAHTHHWIQLAFHRALEFVLQDRSDIRLAWLENSDHVSGPDLDDALILGNVNSDGVDDNLPRRMRAWYIMHNHNPNTIPMTRYRELVAQGRCIAYEVFRGRKDDHEPIPGEMHHYRSLSQANLVLTWGTDLLPNEIDETMNEIRRTGWTPGRNVVFVGSIWRSNREALEQLIQECVRREIPFAHYGRFLLKEYTPPKHPLTQFSPDFVSPEENRRLVRTALVAPALQGWNQLPHPASIGNYIPCRIFKNISYGSLGVSNNASVGEIFGDLITCSDDLGKMLDLAVESARAPNSQERLLTQMQVVRDEHTYLNRLKTLLQFCVERHRYVNSPVAPATPWQWRVADAFGRMRWRVVGKL